MSCTWPLIRVCVNDVSNGGTAIADAGYGAVFVGQSSWNGVAILARGAEPIVTNDALPGDDDDDQ